MVEVDPLAERAAALLHRVPRRAHRLVDPSEPFVTALRASADDLLGVKPVAAGSEPPFTTVELRLWRKFRELRNLPEEERRAVIKVVDSFLAQVDKPDRG